ncbi:hypothetical protein CBR_g3099 [Chara braunii]|uniref:CCHC-type domain-containing protein n=1 Tax=Chara braunii TaxID=69332 RepID=A0A388KER4_CHABU|nr:hypothetical protein CBR_g3099 [Chara braunii]|eukprot:GBG68555.1 hypothetical protein CBR_g3099 [Chara braunii]
MASNGNPNVPPVQNCYNCGQPGHISRFCPLPDRRLNGGQQSVSTAIVPAQPLATYPSTSNVGTSTPYYSGQYNNGGGGSGLGRRVSSLEEIVGRINSKHEADAARESQAGGRRTKREQEEDDRRQKERKEREEFQSSIRLELSTKLDVVREAVNGKKASDVDEIAKLRMQIEMLCKQKEPAMDRKNTDSEEVRKLRARVEELQRAASTSATGPMGNTDELARLRREQLDVKTATEKRLANLEEVIFALQKQCEVAEANAEAWKSEALRPGNKRGSVAIGQTLTTDAGVRPRVTPAVRPRVTPAASPCAAGTVNLQIKAIVERHQQEVELLKEMRLREVNARKASEDEVERLKESLAKLETGRKRGGTNLKSKLDEAAGASTKKDMLKVAASPVVLVSQREATLRDERKKLRNLKKDEVMAICEKRSRVYET